MCVLSKAGHRVCLGHTGSMSVIFMGPYLNPVWAHRWDTLRSCQIVSIYVRVCCVMSGCIMHVVSCQDMLAHVGAMSDVPGDVRECWGRQGPVDLCNGVL